MPPVLNQVNLVVRDMQASIAFYRRLGFTVEPPPGEWADHHVEVRLSNDMTLELDSVDSARLWDAGVHEPSGAGMAAVLGFAVPTREAVDDLYAHMIVGGYTGQQPPYDAFWGARYAIVEDPDSNGIGLMSPSDPDQRIPWPDPPAST